MFNFRASSIGALAYQFDGTTIIDNYLQAEKDERERGEEKIRVQLFQYLNYLLSSYSILLHYHFSSLLQLSFFNCTNYIS